MLTLVPINWIIACHIFVKYKKRMKAVVKFQNEIMAQNEQNHAFRFLVQCHYMHSGCIKQGGINVSYKIKRALNRAGIK